MDRPETIHPIIGKDVFIAPTAYVGGEVRLGDECTVMHHVTIRADVSAISIGRRVNIQDGTVIHVTHDSRFCPGGLPTVIGAEVTVGHKVMLHACTIEDLSLIGMNAVIMDGAIVQSRVMVGAGSVVPPGKILQTGHLYVGSPVKKIRPLNDRELEFLEYSAQNYVRLKNRHRKI